MPDLLYNDDDLRHEASRQYALLVEDPDFMGVGEMMQDSEVESLLPPEEADGAEGAHWDDILDEDQFDEAQRKIQNLISDAADVSRWAIDLGADGLEPSNDNITVNGDEKPIVRMQFAFEPSMSEEVRIMFITGIGAALDALNQNQKMEATDA